MSSALNSSLKLLISLAIPIFVAYSPSSVFSQTSPTVVDKLLRATQYFVDHLEISYVYGGSQVGDVRSCQSCNRCLELSDPTPDKRFKTCPSCKNCSLDCSHFIREIFHLIGAQVPYLTTADMIAASPDRLSAHGYFDVPHDPAYWRTGDIFLYKGHVVLMESNLADGRGTIVHATSGKEVKGSGQGIQRARFIYLKDFRGPLLRVLRHKVFAQFYSTQLNNQVSDSVTTEPNRPKKRFRPIGASAK